MAAVAEINPQAFQQWRHHPVSKAVLEFLAHRAASLEQMVLAQWLSLPQEALDGLRARGVLGPSPV